MTNLSDLIIQLCDELDHSHQCLLDDRRLTHPLADKARATLTEPVPEMNQEHPITPPLELVQQWWTEFERADFDDDSLVFIATEAARWGADQELEACCEWLHWQNLATHADLIPSLRAARRPKPPSLKEQALEALDEEHADMRIQNYKLIRSVLESLPD